MRRLGAKQAVGYVREAFRAGVQRFHHTRHVTVVEVAVIHIVRVILLVLQRRVLLCVLPPHFVPAQIRPYVVRPLIVRVHEDVLLDLSDGSVVNICVLSYFTAPDLFRQQHHKRHLVHTRRIEPFVAVVIPLVAGSGVNIAEAEVLRVDIPFAQKGVCHFPELVRVYYAAVLRGCAAVNGSVGPHLCRRSRAARVFRERLRRYCRKQQHTQQQCKKPVHIASVFTFSFHNAAPRVVVVTRRRAGP